MVPKVKLVQKVIPREGSLPLLPLLPPAPLPLHMTIHSWFFTLVGMFVCLFVDEENQTYVLISSSWAKDSILYMFFYIWLFLLSCLPAYPGNWSWAGDGDVPQPFSQVWGTPCAWTCRVLFTGLLVGMWFPVVWITLLQGITPYTCVSVLLALGLQHKFLEMVFLGWKVKKTCRHTFLRFYHISVHRGHSTLHSQEPSTRLPFLSRFVNGSLLV